MNIIVRPVFNRPEMLYLALKYEQKARDYFDDDYFTIFAVDHGTCAKCFDIIKDYKYKCIVIARPVRYKVCANIMEALKQAFKMDIDYAINMEDDLVLHKSYFEFVNKAHSLVKDKKYSVITTWGYSNSGDPSVLKRSDCSCGPGTIISKDFFTTYMLQFANAGYYDNWVSTIQKVNALNKDNPNAKYGIKTKNAFSHLDWDGLMNRMVDYASYSDGMRGYSSLCYRLLHVGFYGFNRHGGKFPAELKTFEERVDFLEKGIYNPDVLAQLDGVYKDYSVFDSKLDAWDGSLLLKN
jgi:hypothetical protein